MNANYLNYSYNEGIFYRNNKPVPESEVKEIPTYIRLVLRDMAGEPIPKCFTPAKGGNA